MEKLPKQPIKGLLDGITVLQEIATHREPCSVSALSRKLGLEKTKVHRILRTLAHTGIVFRTEEGTYSAGPGMHVLAAQSLYSSGLIQKSLSHLSALKKKGKTVGFGVLWRDKVSFLYHGSPGSSDFESIGRVGLFEATRSSVGMMLLSCTEDDYLAELYKGVDIPGFSSFREFMKDIKQTRKQGYAVLPGEGEHRSIAVVLGQPAYAGIAMAGDTLKEDVENVVALLRETVTNIESETA